MVQKKIRKERTCKYPLPSHFGNFFKNAVAPHSSLGKMKFWHSIFGCEGHGGYFY